MRKRARELVSVYYNVVEQIAFDLLHKKVMDEILNKLIAKYFDPWDSTEKVCGKLQSANALMAPIAEVVECRTSEAVVRERITTKMGKQPKSQKLHADA